MYNLERSRVIDIERGRVSERQRGREEDRYCLMIITSHRRYWWVFLIMFIVSTLQNSQEIPKEDPKKA